MPREEEDVAPPSALDRGPDHDAKPKRRNMPLHEARSHGTKHHHIDGRRECYSRDDE
jgi:hypothetical protein